MYYKIIKKRDYTILYSEVREAFGVMYLKIVTDSSGNTQLISPLDKFDFKCPFCKNKNTFIFEQDLILYCNSCGRQLVTRIQDKEDESFKEDELTEYIRVLKEGGPLYDRIDAVAALGRIPRNHNRIGIIYNILYKISASDPDEFVREGAKESLTKLRGMSTATREVPVKSEVVIQSTSPSNKRVQEEPMEETSYRTFKPPEVIIEEEEVEEYSSKRTEKKKTQIPEEKPLPKKSKFSMEDELLSLLDDI